MAGSLPYTCTLPKLSSTMRSKATFILGFIKVHVKGAGSQLRHLCATTKWPNIPIATSFCVDRRHYVLLVYEAMYWAKTHAHVYEPRIADY